MFEVLLAEQMRHTESAAVAEGQSIEHLMETAGEVIAQEVLRLFKSCPVIVLAGPGNNGGDGFVVARKLEKKGWPVIVACSKTIPSKEGAAFKARSQWKGTLIDYQDIHFKDFALIIDGLFGIGLSKHIDDPYKTVVQKANQSGIPILAIDIPSGIHSDSGEELGSAIKAHYTIALQTLKPCHLLLPGKIHSGTTIVKDIGLRPFPTPSLFVNAPELWKKHYHKPNLTDNKYTRGHGVIVGGSQLTGAARLSMLAARRVGAGLITLLCPPEAQIIYSLASLGHLTQIYEDVSIFSEKLNSITNLKGVLIGPGNPPTHDTRTLVHKILKLKMPTVLDAGALTAFAENPGELLRELHENVVLTPHEGEFKRLFSISGNKIQRTSEAAKTAQCTILLKGADTVIATASGPVIIENQGVPWLATGGTGDVLSGLILGLLVQGLKPLEAAAMANWILNQCAHNIGVGLLAEDIPLQIPKVLASI